MKSATEPKFTEHQPSDLLSITNHDRTEYLANYIFWRMKAEKRLLVNYRKIKFSNITNFVF